jgi:hypothetical protein
MKTNCYKGIIGNWKHQLFGQKIDHHRKGFIFNSFLHQIPFFQSRKNKGFITKEKNETKIKVFKKCNHGFLMSYIQQFHLINEELEKRGYYTTKVENTKKKASGNSVSKRKYKCPFCKFPYKIFNLINSKIISSYVVPQKSNSIDSLKSDLQAVGKLFNICLNFNKFKGNFMKVNEGLNLTKNFLKKTVEYVFTFGQVEDQNEEVEHHGINKINSENGKKKPKNNE